MLKCFLFKNMVSHDSDWHYTCLRKYRYISRKHLYTIIGFRISKKPGLVNVFMNTYYIMWSTIEFRVKINSWMVVTMKRHASIAIYWCAIEMHITHSHVFISVQRKHDCILIPRTLDLLLLMNLYEIWTTLHTFVKVNT